jgi:hypothetical protein
MGWVLVAAVVMALGLAPSTASAESSPLGKAPGSDFKMNDLNVGNVSLGETVSGTISLTNRTDIPVQITGWSLAGAFGHIAGPCHELQYLGGRVLQPGDSCVETVEITAAIPKGPFRAQTCIFTAPYFTPYLYPCSFVRGNVREVL